MLNGKVTLSTAGDVSFDQYITVVLSPIQHNVSVFDSTTLSIAGMVVESGTSGSLEKSGNGTLTLTGNNSFGGGVTLDNGWLLLGHNNAAGTGTLTLNGGTLTPVADITLANNVALNGGIKLGDCNTTNAITFSGVITGSGAFDTHGSGDITFAANNSGWTGGIEFFGANNVFVNHANGLGTGPVTFSSSSDTVLKIADGVNATIGTLSGGDYSYENEINLGANSTLTINQSTDAQFDGSITGYYLSGTTDGGLIKTGAGTLTLSNTVVHYGPTVVNQGGLIIDGSHGAHFAGGPVTVNNSGTIFGVKNEGSVVYHTVTVNSGAKLVGDGYIQNAIINSGATLSPGFSMDNPIGTLTFADLTLGQNGKLEFNLQYDGAGGILHDSIIVQNNSTLTINATPANRFTLKIISLNAIGQAGTLAGGISGGTTYSWLLFDTNGIYDTTSESSTATLSSFQIDTSQFSASLAGSFSLSQTGTDIYLNFTPVPEPSTYALMALGLAGTGLAAWRKRRRS